MHEPQVQCIAKGKAGKQYEFGNKVSVAVSSRGGWFVGAKSFTGSPYDGHTLNEQMKQVKNLIGDRVSEAHVDMGYRGHNYDGAITVHVDKRRRGRTTPALWRWMKRRAAIEPSIGHLKSEHRLERNRLKGAAGNAINAILAAAAINFHKLLTALLRIFLFRLMQACNGLLALQRHKDRDTQLQYARKSLFQDRLIESFGTANGELNKAKAILPATSAIFYTPLKRELIGRLWRSRTR